MAYQRAYFPMEILNITQGYGKNSGSHKNSYAIDFSGRDGGEDNVYAPFDCKITKLYKPKDPNKSATTMWITSTRKVLCSNGYYGYLTMSITHPEEIMNMKVGTKYKQGAFICKEGKTGRASGNHIHLELSTGAKAGWIVINGDYVNVNKVKPEEYLFLKESCVVQKDTYKNKRYKFYKESELTYVVQNVDSPPLNIHVSADTKKSTVNNQGVTLKNGKEVINFYQKNNMSYIYHYEAMGYVVSKYLKKK